VTPQLPLRTRHFSGGGACAHRPTGIVRLEPCDVMTQRAKPRRPEAVAAADASNESAGGELEKLRGRAQATRGRDDACGSGARRSPTAIPLTAPPPTWTALHALPAPRMQVPTRGDRHFPLPVPRFDPAHRAIPEAAIPSSRRDLDWNRRLSLLRSSPIAIRRSSRSPSRVSSNGHTEYLSA
jgi:hypothetical protein